MPLKRDPSLIPLSHDHHHGLARVFEIRQALRAGADLEPEAARARAHYEQSLVPHFEAEEAAVFPAIRAVGVATALVAQLVDEHARLRAMAVELEPTAPSLSAFADLLERHIRMEERELFAQYQEHVPEAVRRGVEGEVRAILRRRDDDAKACDLRAPAKG